MNSLEQPLVSVLVLAYNQQLTITETLQSIADQQTDFKFEIIIGDDCSVDETRVRCEEFIVSNGDINISLFPDSNNVGVVKNFVRLVSVAKGSYIAVCAGDDYWIDHKKLQKQVDFLQANPDYGLIHTNLKILDTKNNKLYVYETNPLRGNVQTDLLQKNFISALTTLSRKTLVEEAIRDGVFDQQFLMEDYPLWLYISGKSKIGFIPDVTAVWRLNRESASQSDDHLKTFLFNESVSDVQLFFAEKNNNLPVVLNMLTEKNRDNLSIAANKFLPLSGKKAFDFLKKNKALRMRDRIMHFASQYKWFHNALKLLKKK